MRLSPASSIETLPGLTRYMSVYGPHLGIAADQALAIIGALEDLIDQEEKRIGRVLGQSFQQAFESAHLGIEVGITIGHGVGHFDAGVRLERRDLHQSGRNRDSFVSGKLADVILL